MRIVLLLPILVSCCVKDPCSGGHGFDASYDWCILARELTDKEIDEVDDAEGAAFSESKRKAEDYVNGDRTA